MMIDSTHDPALRSWVESADRPNGDFPIQNLPYATFRRPGEEGTRIGIGIGEMLLDAGQALGFPPMAEIMAMRRADRTHLRRRASEFLSKYMPGAERWLIPIAGAELLLPCPILDYTDSYASLDHAINVGRLFRPDNPLLPNYKWLPVAYHGRASSIVASSTPVRRPWGQIVSCPAGPPVFAPCRLLDYEVELGAFLGPGNTIGEPIPIAQAEDHLMGVCLLNDWSARDIQTWEGQPLGPFLSKNFATSISPWVVTLDALEPFRCAGPPRAETDPRPLSHLAPAGEGAFRITLEVWLQTTRMNQPVRISRGDFSTMFWTLAQMITHHGSIGCPLRACDLIGSGTVSGPEKVNRGCLLEITSRGAEPLALASGESRTFLEDGDTVILRGFCEAPGFQRFGLGECRGVVLPAHPAVSRV